MKSFALPGIPCMLQLRATVADQDTWTAGSGIREVPVTTERRGSAWYEYYFNRGRSREYTCHASDPVLALVGKEWMVVVYVSSGKWMSEPDKGSGEIEWESCQWHHGGPFGRDSEEPSVWAYLPEYEVVKKEVVMAGQMVRNIVEEKCTTCQGTKVMLMNNAEQRCISCGGTGKAPVTNKEVSHDRHTQ
jgi:hypothetical protein